MRRNKDWWKSKYVLEGITLGEFWQHLRPKGAMHMTISRPNHNVYTGPVTKCERIRNSRKEQFIELWLRRKDQKWIRALLHQKIIISGKSIFLKPRIWDGRSGRRWIGSGRNFGSGDYKLKLDFEADLPFNM